MKVPGHIHAVSKRNGFTLIELIIVLFLLGIVVSIAGLYIGKDTGSLDLKKFTKEISAVMRYARNHAVSEKNIYCFVIDKEEHKFRLYSEDTDYTNIIIVIDKDIPDGLDMDLQGSGRDALYVEFFPGGNTTGGVIEIMNAKGDKYSLMINRVTGKLTVEKQ